MTRRWTPEEDATLREAWNTGATVEEIVALLPGRNFGAVYNKVNSRKKQLGLVPGKGRKKRRKPAN